jgi:tRNA (guanine37-N1)-methyltransferase
MRFIFVTLFPNLIKPYFEDSILKRAIEKKILSVDFVNFRDYSENKHKKVDDTPFGGGPGMVLQTTPLYNCLTTLKKSYPNSKVVFLTPSAKLFNQKDSKRLASFEETIIFVSGRYEGFDERIIEEFADELFSIGDYILTGGELASLVLADSISRNIEGILGNSDSLTTESFENELLEAPTFTKPQTDKKLRNYSVISEFFKGNHSIISSLKENLAIAKTKYHRPDIYQKFKIRKKYEK